MQTVNVHLLTLLGVMESGLLLGVVALLLWLRSNGLARRVRSLHSQLAEQAEVAEPISFGQYLRDEIIRNEAFIDEAAAARNDPETAQLLGVRKQILQLELAARAAEKNPIEFCRTLATGLRELMAQLRPEPQDAALGARNNSEVREQRDTREDELAHLRQVINNQQDAMSALRARLTEKEHEFEGMGDILEKLEDVERQSQEFHQSLQVLEAENERLRQARQRKDPQHVDPGERDPAQLKGLKSMVGKQQATITTLQDLIRELAPEAGKARELQEAIAHIEHTNRELSGCVSVLEDENDMLRTELAELQAHLAEQAVTPAADAAQAAPAPAEERRELEIKVQELEALIEFKDAAIEEMEKQHNALQAKYLALSGKK